MKADGLLTIVAAGVGAIALSLLPVTPRLIWNRTESMPVGLYVLSTVAPLERGMVVAYQPSPGEAAFLETHRYTGRGWPLVKRVAALEGDEVCRCGNRIYINDRLAVTALASDEAGRILPAWKGCRRLEAKDAFLLSDHSRSIDGRYLGVQEKARILGTLRAMHVAGRRDG